MLDVLKKTGYTGGIHICHPLYPSLGEVIWPTAWMRFLLSALAPGFALLKKLLSSIRVGTPVGSLIFRAQEGIPRNLTVVPASKNVKKSPVKEFWVCVPMTLLVSPSLQSKRACRYSPNPPCSLIPPSFCLARPLASHARPCCPFPGIPDTIPPTVKDQVHTVPCLKPSKF